MSRSRRFAAVTAVSLGLTLLVSCADETERYCAALEDQREALTELARAADEPGAEFYPRLLEIWQDLRDEAPEDLADEFQRDRFGRTLFNSGNFMPIGIEYIQETTVFREYGPLAGNTVRIGYEYAPSFGDFLSRQTAEVDARYYKRIATNGVLAFRARGYKSWGEFPGYLYFGGNSELRGYEYLEFLGNKGFFANAELRFPIIEAALTPLGVVGGLRGVFFANLGASGYDGVKMQVWTNNPVEVTPLLGFEQDPTALLGIRPIFGPTTSIDGFKLVDGRASYGIGLTARCPRGQRPSAWWERC